MTVGRLAVMPLKDAPHTHPRRVGPVTVKASILRLSAVQRVAIVVGVLVLLWLAVFWAIA